MRRWAEQQTAVALARQIARGGIAHRCASCIVLLTDHITHEPRVRAGGWEETSAEARLAAIAERRSGVMSVLKREGRSYTNICD